MSLVLNKELTDRLDDIYLMLYGKGVPRKATEFTTYEMAAMLFFRTTFRDVPEKTRLAAIAFMKAAMTAREYGSYTGEMRQRLAERLAGLLGIGLSGVDLHRDIPDDVMDAFDLHMRPPPEKQREWTRKIRLVKKT